MNCCRYLYKQKNPDKKREVIIKIQVINDVHKAHRHEAISYEHAHSVCVKNFSGGHFYNSTGFLFDKSNRVAHEISRDKFAIFNSLTLACFSLFSINCLHWNSATKSGQNYGMHASFKCN